MSTSYGPKLTTEEIQANEKMLIHVDKEPTVITTKLIDEELESSGQEWNKADDPLDYSHVTVLKLEYKDILRIDHLWILNNLVELSLAANLIEKIENLEKLIHLRILNLSYNNISTIENLEDLVNIEVLSLFSNKIKEISNLETLTKLKVFSIGQNLLLDWSNVSYLRKFKSLRAVNFSNNPCDKKENFDKYVLAYLPQLVYYNNKQIEAREREEGLDCFRTEMEGVERAEMKTRAEEEKIRKGKERNELLAAACVDGLERDDLYQFLMANDSEGQALLLMGEKVAEAFHKLKQEVSTVSSSLFEIGLEQLKLRQQEDKMFDQSFKTLLEGDLEVSRQLTANFAQGTADLRNQIREELVGVGEEGVGVEGQRAIVDRVLKWLEEWEGRKKEAWYQLMLANLRLHDKIQDLNGQYDRSMGDLVNKFCEYIRSHFSDVRESEANYFEEVLDNAFRYFASFNQRGADLMSVPAQLRPLLFNKDTIHNAAATSHDVHMLAIDNAEDKVINTVKTRHYTRVADNESREVSRDRKTILEIKKFLEYQSQFLRNVINIDLEKLKKELEVDEGDKEDTEGEVEEFYRRAAPKQGPRQPFTAHRSQKERPSTNYIKMKQMVKLQKQLKFGNITIKEQFFP